MKLIGLDIGTTTICALVLDAGTGEILSVVTRPNGSGLPGKAAWEALQDPVAIMRIAQELVDGFLDRFKDISAIGIAGQMHGILYIDKTGRPCSPLYTWQDGRGDVLEPGGVSTAARLSSELGSRVSTGMGTVTHAFNAAHGLVPREAASLCTIGDYAAMTMSGGAVPRMDTSNAASLGCFDFDRLDFRREAIEKLGLEAGLFPEVTRSFPVLGTVRPGVAVGTAAGDNQASFLGSVREVRSTALFDVGTGSRVSVHLEQSGAIPGIDIRPFPLGGFLAVGAGLCGGTSYALLRRFFERTIRLFTGTETSVSWEAMNAAKGIALDVNTRFSGTRADPAVRGSITGIGVDNFTPENLIAGVREGIAEELLEFYDRMPPAKSVAGSGNGIRLNPALRAVFESRLGMRLNVPRHREETSFGAALLAGISTGALPDLAAAGALVRYEDH
jgi:sedoheptulokinase